MRGARLRLRPSNVTFGDTAMRVKWPAAKVVRCRVICGDLFSGRSAGARRSGAGDLFRA
ncbi:hypothetical protein KCP76_20730 [Salmonella enterica subsp. enterica serovar Weltevreden]|nr:hypothetical protein KCP76_20730 [Salmonella enterica subsp. enterica serovar Weltevreden]